MTARSRAREVANRGGFRCTMTTSIGSSYPLPISITVRNVFPPLAILNNVSTPQVESDTATINDERHCESDNNTIQSKQQTTNSSSIKQSLSSKISSSSVEDRCALVSREVLLRLRLDIVTKPISKCSNEKHSNNTEEFDNDTSNRRSSRKETLVYSSEQTSSTAHPRWDHVDEYLSTLFNDEDTEHKKNCNVLYARFVILSDTTNNDNNPPPVDIKECILTEIPLHPSKLRRLPTITSNDDHQDTNNNNNNNTSMIIPNPLPPNTILLHYNDGYTRTVPNIYWTLVQRGIICESIVDPVIKRYGSGEEYAATGAKDIGDDDRFEDKAFNVLPGDDVTSKQPKESDEEKLEGRSSDQQGDQVVARDNSQTTDDKVFDLLGEAEGTSSKAQPIQGESDTVSIPDQNLAPNSVAEEFAQSTEVQPEENEETPQSLLPELTPLSMSADCQTTTQDEIEELRKLIKIEQHLLEEEQRNIQQGTNHIKSIMQQVQQLENETIEITRAVGVEKTNLFTSEFRLEAHRIHLLQHLQLIFPIKLVPINISVNPPHLPQHQYTIAGLPIPDDIHSPTSTDDQVSTALGFLCHLVSLTSKYLAIPLRYTLVCKFSRSAVLFDQGRDRANGNGKMSRVVYPLFRERGVIDREQLDYGLLLLGRNVDCLLHTRQVATHPAMNILAKMEKLIEKIVEGDRP